MRLQRVAFAIAAGAMFLVLAAAGALLVRERSDAADRSRRTAALEVSRLQAVIHARADALAAASQALMKDPDIMQWATGGKPPAWYTGAPREPIKAPGATGADYVIMEMHGGTAALVHSDPTGSRFRLEWPARAPRPVEARP